MVRLKDKKTMSLEHYTWTIYFVKVYENRKVSEWLTGVVHTG